MHVTSIQVADSLCSGGWLNYALQGDVQQSNLVETSFLMLNTLEILCMQTVTYIQTPKEDFLDLNS